MLKPKEMAGKELGEDKRSDTSSEHIESENELIPDTLGDNLIEGLLGPPRRFVKTIGRKALAFGPWVLQKGSNLRSFLSDPGPKVRATLTKLRRELDTLTTLQLAAVLITFTLFLILPLISVVAYSFSDPYTGLPSLVHFENLFSDSVIWPWQYVNINNQWQWVFLGRTDTIIFGTTDVTIQGWDYGAIINSVYTAILVTFFSVLLGVFLAFIVARYDFFGKSVIRTVLIFPILATPFVGAIGIQAFLGLNGIINNLFYDTLHIFPLQIQLKGLAALVFVQSLSFFSLVYLNAYSSFMAIDPSLEEQAENLGATGSKLFRSVTLPLAMPGIQAGAILTFILSIEDLGTPIVFREEASNQTEHTLAFQVFRSFSSGLDLDPKGPAIGILLLVFALTGFLAIRKYAGVRSYESGTKGGQWNARVRRLSNRTTVILYAILIPLLFLALIPQISVIMISIAGPWTTNSVFPTEWTLQHYSIFTTYPAVTQSIIYTLIYGAIATVIIVLLGTSAAYIIARRDIPGKTYFDLLVTSPIALPGIVIATGYFVLYYRTPFFPLDSPAFLIIMSYTVRKFPFTVRAAYAGLQSTPVVLEEASQNMGASKNQTFAKITMPLIGVSVLAGSLLSFVYSVSEVSTSLILGSLGPEQAPMTYWTKEVLQSHSSSYSSANSAAALGVLMMAMQMTVITITNKILGARSSAMTGI